MVPVKMIVPSKYDASIVKSVSILSIETFLVVSGNYNMNTNNM